MNRSEVPDVLEKVLAYCPSQSMTNRTPDAWAEALDDVSRADALEAVRRIGRKDMESGQSRYIEPGHIRAEVRRMRQERRDAHPTVEPPGGLSPAQLIAWQRYTREAISSGEVIEVPALPRRFAPEDLRELVKGVE